jgi:ribosomal protein S18 acetylase RimI-like enzyme
VSRGSVRPAVAADIDPVCRLLHEQMNSRLAIDRWRRLMTYSWLESKPDFGRVAEVEGRVVGFVGSVYADREIAGRRERVVSMSSWYLDKAYRGRGLGFELMRSATEDERHSYTMLTVSPRNLAMLPGLGYRILDEERRAWAPQSPAPGWLAVELDEARILARVDAAQRRMLSDHAGQPIRPVLLSGQERSCLAVFSVKKKGADVTYFDVLHVSDPAFFARHAQVIADALLPREGESRLAVDKRLLDGREAGGATERMPVARYYKSCSLAPAEVDNMYSELLLLDLKLD